MNSDATTAPLTQSPSSSSAPITTTTTTTDDTSNAALLTIPDVQQTSLHIKNDRASLHAQLHRTLTDLAYLIMATIYYSDQMTWLLFSRWLLVANYATQTTTTPVPYRIPIVLFITVPSILFRWGRSLPVPVTDASRGMLSGSTMVDVVGEFVPSRGRLMALDTLFFLVVVLMLVVTHEQAKAEQAKTAPKPQQDLDAEEQGVRRGETAADPVRDADADTNANRDTNMDDEDEGNERSERDGLLGDNVPTDEDAAVPVITLNMAKSLREIWYDSPVANEESTAARARVREALRGLISAIGSRTNRN